LGSIVVCVFCVQENGDELIEDKVPAGGDVVVEAAGVVTFTAKKHCMVVGKM